MIINTRLALTCMASAGLAAGTVYWLCALPEAATLREIGALAGAFVGQIGLFAAVMGPVAAYAVAGRWTWAVRLLTVISPVIGYIMLALIWQSYDHDINVHENPATYHVFRRGDPRPVEASDLHYVPMLGAGLLLLYGLYVVCTLVWIQTRARAASGFPQASSEPSS